MSEDPKFGALRKGFLEFLVLRIINGSTMYAADILKKLAATDFATQEGTLYPLLSRLRREGLLDYRWQESEAGPPRKYYRLTGAGQRQLADFDAHWERLNQTIDSLGS
ncbi:MAG: PadR family transcriptional regulator [Steroidobacteraceae bacterium]